MADLKALPPRDSRYFDTALYRRLKDDAALWSSPAAIGDPALREAVTGLLHLEARLLDQGRYEEWLDLYDEQCVYWVPSDPVAQDPASTVSLALDDRRRLEDRVLWLRSAYIWSQIPRSRTVRMLGNIEAMRHPSASDADSDPEPDAEIVTRANFVLHDVRGSRHTTHFGWYLHRLTVHDAGWRITAKHVRLAQSDLPHENSSIIF